MEKGEPGEKGDVHKGLKILVAEDNAVMQDLLLTLLEGKGYTVGVASDGRQTVAAWEKYRPDVILMDVQMPEMDGIEAARIIREKERGAKRRTIILAVTAYALDEFKDHCARAGMDGFITKPIDVHDLLSRLDRVERGGERESPPGPQAAAAAEREGKVYDLALVRDIVGDDPEEVKALALAFISTVRERLSDIREAMRLDDAGKARAAAHTVKGLAGQFGAEPLRRTAKEIEDIAASGSLGGVEERLEELAARFDAVERGIGGKLGVKS